MQPGMPKTTFIKNHKGAAVSKEITFANDAGPLSVFTVTGDVICRVAAVCKTSVTSGAAGAIELGVSTDVDLLIVSTTGTDIDADEIWHDASPDINAELEATVFKDVVISAGDDIILTLSAQIDTGVIAFYCFWIPLSSDGNVVAA